MSRAQRCSWSVPLTLLWSLHCYRVPRRWADAGVTRDLSGRALAVGVTLAGWGVAAVRMGFAPCGGRGAWCRDLGRWSVGGWHTDRCVPVSAGWVSSAPGGRGRCGVSVTVASRTLLVFLRSHRW